MARARIITPDFWLDEELAKTSERTRLIYIGLWNFADCNGIIENNTEKIRVQIFPYQKIDIKKNLDELIKLKKIIPYMIEKKDYFWIKNFRKYQKLKNPYYKYPIPPSSILQQYPTDTPPEPKEREKEREKEEKLKFNKLYPLKGRENNENLSKLSKNDFKSKMGK